MPSKSEQMGDSRDLPTVTEKSSGLDYRKNSSRLDPSQGPDDTRPESTPNDDGMKG